MGLCIENNPDGGFKEPIYWVLLGLKHLQVTSLWELLRVMGGSELFWNSYWWKRFKDLNKFKRITGANCSNHMIKPSPVWNGCPPYWMSYLWLTWFGTGVCLALFYAARSCLYGIDWQCMVSLSSCSVSSQFYSHLCKLHEVL